MDLNKTPLHAILIYCSINQTGWILFAIITKQNMVSVFQISYLPILTLVFIANHFHR